MEPRKARITILNDVSLQCCPVPGSQVRSLLHDSVWEKLYHRKRKYPWNTSCWPSHTHTTCKAFTKLERNVDPYFSHLVGQPIPKRRTKTECTVDKINRDDLLKNLKQRFFKKEKQRLLFSGSTRKQLGSGHSVQTSENLNKRKNEQRFSRTQGKPLLTRREKQTSAESWDLPELRCVHGNALETSAGAEMPKLQLMNG